MGPDGQGLHGGPGSLGWGKDKYQAQESLKWRIFAQTFGNSHLGDSVAETFRGTINSYSTLCSQGCPEHQAVCMCAYVSVRVLGVGTCNGNTDPGPCPLVA